MQNKITENYFTLGAFAKKQENEALKDISDRTGFATECEIFRGLIYESKKVGSIIWLGTWKNKKAVLKLQILKPAKEEYEIIQKFNSQNKSKLIRLPIIFAYEPWQAAKGYSYLITEFISSPKIFKPPFASLKEMKDFALFYQEYRTRSLTDPWIESEETDSWKFTLKRLNHWQKISESKKRLEEKDFRPYLEKFHLLAKKHLPSIPMVFCHGHLTANDIYKPSNNSYVLFSNLFWGWRPEYYDLAFNIWFCLLNIRDTNYNFKKMLAYINQWLTIYREIPITKQDPDFNLKIHTLLLERTMGAILVDLGADEFYGKPENYKYFSHLLGLHQKLFDYLAKLL